jgi:FRG domain
MFRRRTKTSVPLRSITAFIEEFDRYFSGSTQLKCYRGQRDSSWPNVAGIFRPDFKELLEDEKRAVRKLISVQPHEFASDETMFDKLVRMQHFGLPTRLLDVSRNAMVALFFATDPGPVNSKPSDGLVTAFAIPPELEKYYDSDSVSCIANLANMTGEEKAKIFQLKESLTEDLSETRTIELFNKDGVVERLLQFIRAEKPYFQPIMNPVDLFVPYYVHPKMSNRRILAQAMNTKSPCPNKNLISSMVRCCIRTSTSRMNSATPSQTPGS